MTQENKIGKVDFESRQAEKLERCEELSQKNHEKSKAGFKQAREMGDVIPFGQPILVGHHSEKGHRNLLKKIDNKMRKSIEDDKKGDYYDNKVKNLENPYAISQDDPEAIKKLKEKIADLEKDQKKWRAVKVNKNAKSCFDLDSQNWKSVQLNSISAEIRRCKKRIEQLIAKSQIEQVDETTNGINLVVDQDENRVMIYFPGKPDEEIRTKLKRNGFRWSPRNMAWQAFISTYAISRARGIIKEVKN